MVVTGLSDNRSMLLHFDMDWLGADSFFRVSRKFMMAFILDWWIESLGGYSLQLTPQGDNTIVDSSVGTMFSCYLTRIPILASFFGNVVQDQVPCSSSPLVALHNFVVRV